MRKTLPSPDGEGFFYKPLETAAKRRWESEGRIPSGGFGRQPNRNPVPIKKEVVSEQNAKHSTIETGLR